MSTNISTAWKFKTTATLAEAITLAKAVAAIQKDAVKDEIVQSFGDASWMPWYDYIVESFGNIPEHLGRIVVDAIYPVMQSQFFSPVWGFPNSCLEALEESLSKNTRSMALANRGYTMSALESFCKDIYVEFARRDASLMFLNDDDGTIYVKGFALTLAAERYMDTQLVPFPYTDATDMDEADFPEYAEAFAAYEPEDPLREELLASAQNARGKKWDEILRGQSNWKGLGLTYSLNDMDKGVKRLEIMEVVRGILAAHAQGCPSTI